MGGLSNDKSNLSAGQKALIGGAAGAVEITFAYPFEFAKVVQQLYPKQAKKSPFAVLKKTIARGGVSGCYKGYPLLLTAGVPKAYVRFGIYNSLMDKMNKKDSMGAMMLAGGIAGGLEGLFIHVPVENMKVKLIHDKVMPQPKYRSVWDGISRIYRKQGFKGVTRGALPNTIKESSNHAMRFPI